MNRRKRWGVVLLALIALSSAEAGLHYNECFNIANRKSWQPVPHHQIAFFNGVRTSSEAGTRGSVLLGELADGLVWYAEKSSALLYNTHENLWFDLIETFAQRIEEANGETIERYNLALDVASGRNEAWKAILAERPGLKPFHDWLKRDLNRRLTEALKLGPSKVTQADYDRHERKLRDWVNDNRELVLVGYSQGNLFANHAYEYLQREHPSAFVDVIHIAPASIRTYGPHVLADRDLVIKALPGQVPAVNASIPPFLDRPSMPKHGRDVLGHGLLNTYLHPDLETSYAIEQHLYDAIRPKQSEEATFWQSIPMRNVDVPEGGRLTPSPSAIYVDGKPVLLDFNVDLTFARPYMSLDCFYSNANRLYEGYTCKSALHKLNVDLKTFKIGHGCEWSTLSEPSAPRSSCYNFGGRHFDGSINLKAIIDRNGILRYHPEKPMRFIARFSHTNCLGGLWLSTPLTPDFGIQSLTPANNLWRISQ